MSQGIIVLGMHRSGTSLIAELVHRWGAFGCVEKCLPSDQWNARGYWELAPLVDFNQRLLEEVRSTWNFPPGQEQDSRLAALAEHPAYRAEAQSLLALMKPHGDRHWFWKDPRLSLLLPFWRKIWGRPRYIICSRDPLEICQSLRERDNLGLSISIVLWQRYVLAILEGTSSEHALVVSYSKLLRNPEHECKRLATFLMDGNGEPNPTAAARTMRKSIAVELQHCKADLRQEPALLTNAQQKLHEMLEDLADSGKAAPVAFKRCSLPPLWRTLLRGNLLLRRCRQRWDRTFQNLPVLPDAGSEAEAIALSRAPGFETWQ